MQLKVNVSGEEEKFLLSRFPKPVIEYFLKEALNIYIKQLKKEDKEGPALPKKE